MEQKNFHEHLKEQMDNYVHFVYATTKDFPKEEIYGVTSQLRRSAPSVILNYVEGFARGRDRDKVYKNFLEISYGSLKESKYLLHFSLVEKYLSPSDYKKSIELAEEIGAMLWSVLKSVKS